MPWAPVQQPAPTAPMYAYGQGGGASSSGGGGGTVAAPGPAFSAYVGTNQSIPAGAFTLLAANTEEYDTDACYDTSSGMYRFQPDKPGYYRFTANIYLNPISTGDFSLALYKNGAAVKRGPQPRAASWSVNITATIFLNGSTDYVDCRVYAQNGVTVTSGAVGSYFQGELVRTT